jgi:hypothetical protein
VTLRLNQFVQPTMLDAFDEVILASGIVPRTPEIEGIDHPKVLSYLTFCAIKRRSARRWRLSAAADRL